MKMLVHVKFPHEVFNKYVKDGTAGQKLEQILAEIKPEAVYFTEQWGYRGAIMLINLASESDIPKIAEPWFLMFNADVKFNIVMTPEMLKKANLDALGKKWA
jgi:hypothetical protein